MLVRFLSTVFFLCVAATAARATDVYVDAVNGNDGAAGTSPATAWKTITHASAASMPNSLIHLAPGTYSTASGEVFPLMFHGHEVVGDAGAASTVIDAGGAIAIDMHQVQGPVSNMLTRLTGVTGRNAQIFARINTEFVAVTPAFIDVRFENVSGVCIAAEESFYSPGWGVQVSLEHVDFSQAHAPMLVSIVSYTGHAVLSANDCDFSNSTGWGIGSNTGFLNTATFDRCRFTHIWGYAFQDQDGPNGRLEATFRDCLIAHCGSGINRDTNDPTTSSTVQVTRCTVVDNAGVGIRNRGGQASTSIDGTIVTGNVVDVLASSATTLSSWISAGNPLFVDPANDDYRLRFGSPCIDQGLQGSGSGAPDLAHVVRPIDGNLDTQRRTDIGAFEFQPLRLVTSAHVGTPVRLEMSGQAGGTTTVYFARSAPSLPISTQFGLFELNPASFGTLLHSGVAPFPPVAFQRPIPNSPALIGHTFSFQALTTSNLAPQGSAYSNVVSFTVLP